MKKAIAALIAVLLIAVVAVFVFESRDASKEKDKASQSADVSTEAEYDEIDDKFAPPEDAVYEDEGDYDNGITFDEESEDAEVDLVTAKPNDFVGHWEATSGQAYYLYGGIDITIETNGTWKGTITDESLRGKWVERDGGIYLTSELFNCSIKKSADGKMIMQEDYQDSDEEAPLIVLTR